jgi:hypothetical protein
MDGMFKYAFSGNSFSLTRSKAKDIQVPRQITASAPPHPSGGLGRMPRAL